VIKRLALLIALVSVLSGCQVFAPPDLDLPEPDDPMPIAELVPLPEPPSPQNEATFTAVANPDRYPSSAQYITVEFTNTSAYEGFIGFSHRIDRYDEDGWTAMALVNRMVGVYLPPGESASFDFDLRRDSRSYTPGRYRAVLTGVPGQLVVEFTLS